MQRYLNDEPVQACPPSAGYRLQKFIRRNKVALVTATLVTMVLVTGTVVSTWQAIRATEAEALAQEGLEGEKQARQEAMANFRMARAAVDQLLTRVAEEGLVGVPHLQRFREAILGDEAKFYQEFVQKSSDDPELRFEGGRAWRRLGDTRYWLGQNDEAEESFQESIAVLNKLTSEFPSARGYLEELGLSYGSLANLQTHRLGEHQKAEQNYRRCLALLPRVIADTNAPKYQEYLAGIHIGLGNAYFGRGRDAEAEDAFRKATTAAAILAERFPNDRKYRAAQVESLAGLSNVLERRRRSPEAETVLRQALAIQLKLLDERPSNTWYRQQLAFLYLMCGNRQQAIAKSKEAEESFRRAKEINDKLVADFPDTVIYREQQMAIAHALAMLRK